MSDSGPRERRLCLDSLLEVVRAPGLEESLEALARRTLEDLRAIMGCDRAFLVYAGVEAGMTTCGVTEDHRGGWSPVRGEAVMEHVRWTGEAYVGADRDTSVAAVPLVIGERVQGAVGVEREATQPPLEEGDLRLLEILGPQVLSTLEIARLLGSQACPWTGWDPTGRGEGTRRWARIVAHDLGNVLLVMQLAVQELADSEALGDAVVEVESLRRATERIVELARGLERGTVRPRDPS